MMYTDTVLTKKVSIGIGVLNVEQVLSTALTSGFLLLSGALAFC